MNKNYIRSPIVSFIVEFEGFSYKAYKCPAGVWTIGYGHTHGVKESDTCTIEQAEEWLIAETEKIREKIISWKIFLTQNQITACTSFFYNCGFVEKMVNRIKENKLEDFSEYLLKYTRAGGKELSGLIIRRKKEYELFNKEDC